MKINQDKDTIVVFTFKPVDYMIRIDGGSGNWVLNRRQAIKCKYVVCTRNRFYHGTSDEQASGLKQGNEPHQQGFLIATIKDVVPVQEVKPDDKRNRWVILFDEYATISENNLWDGSRNPIAYKNLKDLDININNLNFKKIPERENRIIETSRTASSVNENKTRNIKKGLSILEAKKALSSFYEVSEKSIEIIIKG